MFLSNLSHIGIAMSLCTQKMHTLECIKIEWTGANDVFSADFNWFVLSDHEELGDNPGIQGLLPVA